MIYLQPLARIVAEDGLVAVRCVLLSNDFGLSAEPILIYEDGIPTKYAYLDVSPWWLRRLTVVHGVFRYSGVDSLNKEAPINHIPLHGYSSLAEIDYTTGEIRDNKAIVLYKADTVFVVTREAEEIRRKLICKDLGSELSGDFSGLQTAKVLVNPDGSFNYAATDDRVIWKYTANSPYIRASKPVYSKSTYVLNLTHISKIAEDLDMTAQLFAPNREWHISVSEPICCFPDGFYSVSYNVEKQPQALLSLPSSLVSALVMCDNSEDVSIIEPSMVARSRIRFNKVGITTLHLSDFALQRNMECTDCSFNTDIKSTTFRQTGEFVKCDFNGKKLALTGKDITLTLNNVSNIAVDMNIYTDIVPHQVSDARLTLMDTHIPEGDFHFKSSDAAPYLTISALNSTIRLPDMCYPEGSLTIKEFGTGSVTWDKLEFGSIQLHPSSSAKEKAIFKPRTKSQLLNVLLSNKANHPASWVLDLRDCEVGNSLQLSAELGAKFQIEAIYLPPVQRLEILTSILGFLHGPIVLSDTKHIRIKNDVHLMVVGIKSDDQPMTIDDDEFTAEGPLSATERFWAAYRDAGY